MQLWDFLKSILQDILQKRRQARQLKVKPYRVNRPWIGVERERVNDAIKDKKSN